MKQTVPRRDSSDATDDLTKEQVREIQQAIEEADDPTRYLLASILSEKIALYYIVEDDSFIMNRYRDATAFKSKKVADAVKKALGGSITLLEATRGKKGGLKLDTEARAALARGPRKRG